MSTQFQLLRASGQGHFPARAYSCDETMPVLSPGIHPVIDTFAGSSPSAAPSVCPQVQSGPVPDN